MFYLMAQEAVQPVVAATVAAVPPEQAKTFLELLMDGSFFAKVVGVMVGIQIILYAFGEGLTRISVYTENKWDNKLAEKLSSIAWVLGLIVSKFGYSIPKLVIEEKAKKLEEKGD